MRGGERRIQQPLGVVDQRKEQAPFNWPEGRAGRPGYKGSDTRRVMRARPRGLDLMPRNKALSLSTESKKKKRAINGKHHNFRENEEGNFAYIVESGAVNIIKRENGKDVVLGRIGPGRLFGDRGDDLYEMHLEVINQLGLLTEFRDSETGHHIARMSKTSMILARAAGMNEDQCRMILHASPMHDLGKIGVPDKVLLKPAKLDDEEWTIMRTHPTIGARILSHKDSVLMGMAGDIALTHHEKWDGSGYPEGLKGEDIPMAGRITAICDVYDALTSHRPYKKAWSVESAFAEIKKGAGSHFDPALAPLFLEAAPQILAVREQYPD